MFCAAVGRGRAWQHNHIARREELGREREESCRRRRHCNAMIAILNWLGVGSDSERPSLHAPTVKRIYVQSVQELKH